MNILREIFAIEFSSLLMALYAIISSFELWLCRSEFRPNGWLDWSTAKYVRTVRFRALDRLFHQSNSFESLIGLRALTGLSIVIFQLTKVDVSLSMAMLFALQCLLHYRVPIGREGADDMAVIVMAGSACFLLTDSYFGGLISAGFVTSQFYLSYFFSGLGKLKSRPWIKENSLAGIFGTISFGQPLLFYVFTRHANVSFAVSYFLIIWQVTMPISFFMGDIFFLFYIIVAILFHIFVSFSMGLNNFVFSFFAAIPYAIFVRDCMVGSC